MRLITWNDLAPEAAAYLPVNVGRVTQGVLTTAQTVADDSNDATGWLQRNTPTSLLGLGYVAKDKGMILAALLDAPAHLQIFRADPPVYLPAGTDVCAHYSGDRLQYINYYIPVPDMQVRPVPPFCARVHNGAPLLPDIDPRLAFSLSGKVDLMMASRALAVEAGSNQHVADIDKRLGLLMAGMRAGNGGQHLS